MTTSFEVDPHVTEIAEAYSLDAIDIASRNFGITLDWSEASVRKVEEMLARLHEEMANAQPTEDAIWTFAKAFGSYVGEVFRRHHGGEWGMTSVDGRSFPGFQQQDGALCWPWSMTYKRLKNGPEDNVWHYYSVLMKDAA